MPKKLDKKEASRIAKLRWEKMTPQDRLIHSIKMNEKRWGRGIIPKDKEVGTPSKDNT